MDLESYDFYLFEYYHTDTDNIIYDQYRIGEILKSGSKRVIYSTRTKKKKKQKFMV